MISAARWSAILLLFCCAFAAPAADRAPLERGTAIIDPAALRELDGGRFALSRIMMPERSADTPLTAAQLFHAILGRLAFKNLFVDGPSQSVRLR